jgi:uncharacterized protein (TIGR02453 family)
MAYFTRDGLAFLDELGDHNEKRWFDANKARFEDGLREPALRLILDLTPVLSKLSKHFTADPRPNGGSLGRIYRDTRFSKDKSPYKTALFLHFRHRAGTEEAMPGFFMHIQPRSSRVGGGVWHPATPALEKVRKAITRSPDTWAKAKAESGVGAACVMGGEMLKKVPRGYDPEHIHAEDLKRKDFGVTRSIDDSALTGKDLVAQLSDRFRTSAPVLAFLCKSIGLPF